MDMRPALSPHPAPGAVLVEGWDTQDALLGLLFPSLSLIICTTLASPKHQEVAALWTPEGSLPGPSPRTTKKMPTVCVHSVCVGCWAEPPEHRCPAPPAPAPSLQPALPARLLGSCQSRPHKTFNGSLLTSSTSARARGCLPCQFPVLFSITLLVLAAVSCDHLLVPKQAVCSPHLRQPSVPTSSSGQN